MSRLRTRLGNLGVSDRLGLRAPIFGFSHAVEVVAAITNAGGYGVYGATRRLPEEIEAELAWIRARVGDRPFGVDLVIPAKVPEKNDRAALEKEIPEPHRAFIEGIEAKYAVPKPSGPGMRTRFIRSEEIQDAQIAAVAASDVDLVALGIGCPPEVVATMKARGKTTVALVGQERHAAKALEAGVDLLVAQGYDAGGHTGVVGTFSLVPRIVDLAGDVPVLAAGGVSTGRHVAAALAMGAAGVWVGTAFLLTEENASHLTRGEVEALVRSQATDTVISRAESGKPFRQTRSAWSEEWAAPGAPQPLGHPLHDVLVGDILGAIEEHDVRPLAHSGAGQGIGWFDRMRPVADVMADLTAEAEAAIDRMSRAREEVPA
ncbi:NAD(P)H-dependent flavin oxidoreductase YrpB, nitropropane dioxygenase family [Albimonas donghaensis]|uniref:NAD(P)H-dependent flavin oxidoreductase YrpB, nitropropane dioxygenase family n=1 Tax=Albimonas donghaensis TaxID=356660 RepID=A0A1H2R4S0_9RHOB|nr:nitronate monooxygenase [Albimonas donghaensis]SDW13874.1 NAD(P)H-dependent flavin oxidoreductase YrpB, nitropropane dioxygenase family [Albimonas donghaensis]